MCLGVPGEVLEIDDDPAGMAMGRVSFGGVVKDVCLAYTPEVEVGDFVVVHVGFAISRIDEESARQVFEYLREMDELAELEDTAEEGPEGEDRSTSGEPTPSRQG